MIDNNIEYSAIVSADLLKFKGKLIIIVVFKDATLNQLNGYYVKWASEICVSWNSYFC